MKQTTQFGLLAFVLAMTPLYGLAQTTFFTDTFANGSTTNGASIRSGSPTASATSYDIASTKNTVPGTNGVTIAPNHLHLALTGTTTSGFLEAQAVFATNGEPVALSTAGDYIDISVVFTNTAGAIFNAASSALWIGLYNSGGTIPLAGNLAQSGLSTTTGSPYATGNCAAWQGYVAQVNSGGSSKFYTRPVQTGGTTSANQELVAGGIGSGAFVSPAAGAIATLSPNATVSLAASGAYTLDLRLTLTSPTTMTISNAIFSGVGIGGAMVFSQISTNVVNSTFLTTVFDGFCVGLAGKLGSPGADPIMDISAISIVGQSTPITSAPTITSEPVPVLVANNGACVFSVGAVGSGVTYQWNRNGAPLANGGDISGATTSQLVISPAQASDAVSGANGYFCTVTGTGNYSTNTTTNSLTLVPAVNLTFTAAGGAIWDLNNTVSWKDGGGTAQTFNYGDGVRFDDTASSKFVTLTGNFLSASSVTVDSESGQTYSFSGSGSFAGPGDLIYTGAGQLTLNNANTYSGGTLVSNTVTPGALYVYLENYDGLGTGPVVLDNSGGTMEITTSGSGTLGINGNINLLDDFNIKADGVGTYATVFLGDLSGTSGKTLTINPGAGGTTNRFRAYGTNTVFNGNLVLDNIDSPTTLALYNGTVLAPYGASGSQTYNGVISGVGGIVQRGNGTTILNGLNTYSGGTYNTAGSIGFGIDSSPTSGTVLAGPIGTGPLFVAPEVGTASGAGSSGEVYAAGGAHVIANPLQYPSGTNNQVLIIGGSNSLTLSGAFALNGQDGQGSPTNRTIQVTNTAPTIFSGVISDGGSGYGLTKTGNGILVLNNAETYTGPTTVSAGALEADGQLAGGAVSVATNSMLKGIGTILGPVTITNGGSLAPGTSSIGTLTINNNLTMAGNALFKLNESLSPSNDTVVVSGTLNNTGTGTLTVTNVGPALSVGDTFALFSKPVANGNALTVTGAGVVWTNRLALDGSISVLSTNTLPNTPTNISVSVNAGNITITWPGSYLGWQLEAQTNALSSGLNTNNSAWLVVAGSTTTTNESFTINPSNPCVFYRLAHP